MKEYNNLNLIQWCQLIPVPVIILHDNRALQTLYVTYVDREVIIGRIGKTLWAIVQGQIKTCKCNLTVLQPL